MPYEVIDTDKDEALETIFETHAAAAKVARRLRAYEIWRIITHNGNCMPDRRVECCEPYEGDDDRVKQGLGQWNASELEA